jgi:hypothetical protein
MIRPACDSSPSHPANLLPVRCTIRWPLRNNAGRPVVSSPLDHRGCFCGGLVALVQFVSEAVISSQVAQGGNEFDPLRHTYQSQPYQVSSNALSESVIRARPCFDVSEIPTVTETPSGLLKGYDPSNGRFRRLVDVFVEPTTT